MCAPGPWPCRCQAHCPSLPAGPAPAHAGRQNFKAKELAREVGNGMNGTQAGEREAPRAVVIIAEKSEVAARPQGRPTPSPRHPRLGSHPSGGGRVHSGPQSRAYLNRPRADTSPALHLQGPGGGLLRKLQRTHLLLGGHIRFLYDDSKTFSSHVVFPGKA